MNLQCHWCRCCERAREKHNLWERSLALCSCDEMQLLKTQTPGLHDVTRRRPSKPFKFATSCWLFPAVWWSFTRWIQRHTLTWNIITLISPNRCSNWGPAQMALCSHARKSQVYRHFRVFSDYPASDANSIIPRCFSISDHPTTSKLHKHALEMFCPIILFFGVCACVSPPNLHASQTQIHNPRTLNALFDW